MKKSIFGIYLSVMLGLVGVMLLYSNPKTQSLSESSSLTVSSRPNAKVREDNVTHQTNKSIEIGFYNPEEQEVIKEYLNEIQLEESIIHYFDHQISMGKDERALMSQQTSSQINQLENTQMITPIEALSLKLALLKTISTESKYPELANNIINEYQDKISAEAPEIDYEKNANYKQREREVLLEVQAMSQYPNGMSQSEYLRHSLQLLRTEVFEGSD